MYQMVSEEYLKKIEEIEAATKRTDDLIDGLLKSGIDSAIADKEIIDDLLVMLRLIKDLQVRVERLEKNLPEAANEPE